MAHRFRLRLLGDFRLTSADGDAIVIPRRKGTALLAYLGATIGSVNTRDKLASLLWGQSEQRLARQSLRQILRKLGQDLSGGSARILRLDGQTVSLDSDYLQIDAPDFEALIAQGDEESLTKAAGLYKGEFLAGINTDSPDFEEWLDQSRSRFRDLALHGLVRLVEQQYAAGDLELAAKSAGQALRIEPFREDIHRRLMRMYAERGMRAAALAQYRECESVLRRELGVAPDEETVGLYIEIVGRREAPRAIKSGRPVRLSVMAAGKQHEAPLLVGFDQELALLQKHLRDATRSGARLVLVAGDSGSGKTALLEGFRWDMGQEDAAMVMARAHPAEQTMNFAFWRDLLNKGVLEPEDKQKLSPQFARQFAFLRGAPTSNARPLHDTAAQPWHAFDAMVELIRVRSEDAALALVMDDLHFADVASLRLLSYAVRNLQLSPILFIAAVRPETLIKRRELADILDDLDRDKLVNHVAIHALERAEVKTLVSQQRQKNHVAMVSRARLREIWNLSDGNPGMVVEAALASGREGITGTLPGLPEGLYAELTSRLDGLDDTAKLLAATASVIGERIEHMLLARAADVDEDKALRGVEALIAAGILSSQDEVLTFARGRFLLAQYRSLLPARRRQIHHAVAQTIASEPIDNPSAHFAALAYHYKAAGRVVDALQNDVRLAQVQLRQGAHAMARRSFRHVLQALQAGANSLAESRCEVEARLGLAEVEEVGGNFGVALGELRAPAMRKVDVFDAPLRARYLAALGRLNGVLGNEEIGQGYVRRAAARGHTEEGRLWDDLWRPSDRILEFIHLLGGNFQVSIDRMMSARVTARRRGLVVDEATISTMICLLEAAGGAADTAMAEAQVAINSAARLGDSRLLAASFHVRGITQIWRGDTPGALHTFAKAVELATLDGDLPRLYLSYGYRGYALAILRRNAEAMADLDTALNMAEELNLVFSRPLFQAWKAGVLAEAGDHTAALSMARTALKSATAANRPWPYSVALRAMACALAHPDLRDFPGAERVIRMALSEQDTMGLEFERAQSLVAYARILRSAGETRRSVGLVRQARKLLRKMKAVINREAVRGLTSMLCTPCNVSS